MSRTIALDFDGVIHKYREGWKDGSIYDEIDVDVLAIIHVLLQEGNKVFILSTRSAEQIDNFFKKYRNGFGIDTEVIPPDVKFWNKKDILGICNHKVVFDVLIDDRAITYKGDPEVILNAPSFKTYQKDGIDYNNLAVHNDK